MRTISRPIRTCWANRLEYISRPRPQSLRSTFSTFSTPSIPRHISPQQRPQWNSQTNNFSTYRALYAQPSNVDALMESLNELYAVAKDEFEMAAEETEKKTVYAADDRAAAQEAFQNLKSAYEKTVKESGPDVGKDIQGRVGQRIKELEHALTALEESAMEG